MSAVLDEVSPTLPTRWYWTTMGEIAEVIGGGTPRTNDPRNFNGGDVPWITPADLSGYTEKYITHGARSITRQGLESSSARLLPAGAVLFTSRAPIGYVAIARNPVATNQGFKSFVLKDGVLPEYVYWWLKGSKQRAEALASGTTFLELSGANAKKLPIPIAPIDEQRRIVAEIEKQFSRLDEAVANLKRVKANLRRYKSAVLRAAVEGRLVPTEADLAREASREYEPGAMLLRRTMAARKSQSIGRNASPQGPSSLGLPLRPDGWVWATTTQACERVVDCHNKTAPYAVEGIPIVRTTNIRDGRLLFEDMRYVDQKTYEFWARRCPPQPGDVLFTREAPMGEAAIVPPGIKVCLGQRTMLMRPSLAIHKEFLLVALQSPVVKELSARLAVGSGVKHLRVGDVERLPIPLPPSAEQERIVAEVERRLSIVREVEAEVDANLARARALRQAVVMRGFG